MLFSFGFRPFFLAAGLYAVLAMAAWLAWIALRAATAMPAFMTIAEPLHLWHAHEMVFGYGAAAAGGFLLTAVPSWTGTSALNGWRLGSIFGLWLLGRVAMWFTAGLPPLVPAVLDIAFLPVLGILLARKLAVRPKKQNFVFLGLVAMLIASNVIFHLGRLNILKDGMSDGTLLGLGSLVVMITVIGGRVVPGFTRNVLVRRGIEDRLPRSFGFLDRGAIISVLLFFLLQWLDAPGLLVGAVALIGAIVNGARLYLWRGLSAANDPILLVLHVGYGWIAAGLALAAAALLFNAISDVAALHAFSIGAVGTMTLAIMSRAALGHTGRALVAPRPVVLSYILISLAALLRVFGPGLAPGSYEEIMIASGLMWIAAFALYSIVFAPILLGPRLQDRAMAKNV